MSWNALYFGKHQGRTLPEVVLTDPDWVFWAAENHLLDQVPRARELCAKARTIAFPGPRVVDYIAHPWMRKLSHIEVVVPSDVPRDEDRGVTRLHVFDLCFARQLAPRDKTGSRRIIDALRKYVFEPRGWKRMTKARCEEFFDDASCFAPDPM